ncbi:MAG: phosphatase PAP2 family protein [Treponema sp.]|nr:phosphatase PAP2 family protein [Treponema sp.]
MNNFLKNKIIAIFILSVFISLPLSADEKPQFNLWGSGEVFKLDAKTDFSLIGAGSLLYGTELILSKGLKLNQNLYEDTRPFPNMDGVNTFDRFFAQPYNHTMDKVCDVFLASSFLLPLALGVTPNSEWFTILTMYGETMLLSQGIKETVKLCVYRPRPYMYFDGFPEKDVYKDHDWANSFLSGHTTMSFAAASFTSYTFCKYFPDSPWKYVVTGGSFAFATTIGVMRIMAGCHFPTDVLCGAVLGTSIGFLVPWLHTFNLGKEENAPKLAVAPNGVMVTLKF